MSSPYDVLGALPTFQLTSSEVVADARLAPAQVSGLMGAGGEDRSPQLEWSGFPAETKSFAVTVFDPDAPTVSGFWHWAVCNIPVEVTELPSGAGDPDSPGMPSDALTVPSELRLPRFLGAAPPPGLGRHRYCFAVHALDVERIDVDPSSTPAVMCFTMRPHLLARAELEAWYKR